MVSPHGLKPCSSQQSPLGSPTDVCAPPRDHLRVCRFGLAGGFRATNSRARMSGQGRPLPTANVGFPVYQPEGQLSGGEIARLTGAGRPNAADQAHPTLANARTANLRTARQRSSRSWPPRPGQEPSSAKGGMRERKSCVPEALQTGSGNAICGALRHLGDRAVNKESSAVRTEVAERWTSCRASTKLRDRDESCPTAPAVPRCGG